MKHFLLLIASLLINTSCITVSDNTLPKEEYASASKWGGSVSAIYKVEQSADFINEAKMESSRVLVLTIVEPYGVRA